jgi:competence protein ComEA
MFQPALTRFLPLVALSALLSSPVFAQKDFPDGPAREFVNKICLQCHEPAQLLNQKRTESDWRTTIDRMSKKGIPGSAEQYDAITAYMAKNFGKTEDSAKVNMNKAKADEIVAAVGLTPEEAQALVAYREKHGDYREWGEMLVVYGVDGRKLEAKKDKMSF